MRSEQEMLHLIKETALQDHRIRAAYLEGSRANPNAPRDMFQDFDVVYIVTETASFREDKGWVNRFGERLYMQLPEESIYFPSNAAGCYGWLMQLADGNRLDLHVCTWEHAKSSLELYITLVDKDNLLPQQQMISEQIYWVKRPKQEHFSCTCNEFWWCLNNVAKGLWRKEIPYVMEMLDMHIRPELRRLLEWKIGTEREFSVNTGKFCKYLGRYLPDGIYQKYLMTYSPALTEDIWRSVFLMCDLFDETAREVSQKLGLTYNTQEAANSRRFLADISKLPPDAETIY